MDRFTRIVLGYHGCDLAFAESLLSGETKVERWKASRNRYDWLGHGIYFWEHAPERARTWAEARNKAGVVGAVIQLGQCLDFTDVDYTALLGGQYDRVRGVYGEIGRKLPANRKGHNALDCLIINDLVDKSQGADIRYQTVRCPFLEGDPAFPGSQILKESHIQVAVRDTACILGVFRPNFP